MTGEELAAVIAALQSLRTSEEPQSSPVSKWKTAARMEAVENDVR
jgi:hypothetical protein